MFIETKSFENNVCSMLDTKMMGETLMWFQFEEISNEFIYFASLQHLLILKISIRFFWRAISYRLFKKKHFQQKYFASIKFAKISIFPYFPFEEH